MQPAGLEIYKHRKEDKSRIFSYESEAKQLEKDLEGKFKANDGAWEFLHTSGLLQENDYSLGYCHAKQEATRARRLEKVIAESEKQKRLF
ncbi:MAG: YdeI/OmpD-associated family protein [Marinilabiliales bacterium]|nr:YdeI/OmpD-associated family protein [Marinilabiliales bacterium]